MDKINGIPLTHTLKAVAALLGFDRRAVAGMCRRGEIGFIPCLGPDGKPSRLHKRIAHSEVLRWIEANTIRTPEQFKAALDGRRRQQGVKRKEAA